MKTSETLKDYGVCRSYTIAELLPEYDGMATQSAVIRMSNKSFITVERVDVMCGGYKSKATEKKDVCKFWRKVVAWMKSIRSVS
jgi:hypothetical protein